MSQKFTTISVGQPRAGVLEVCLNRPDIRNAFNETMIQELTHVFMREVYEPNIKVILLKGAGTVFCAGGDLNWMKKSVEATKAANLEDTRALTRMFALMNECPKPIVGIVQGAAIGGGVGLVSVCDYVITTKDAQFSLSEVRLGIMPACIGPFVVSKIGASYARALFISAQRFLGERAAQIGLVHEVVSDATELEKSAEKLLENLLACGPNAIMAAKKLVLDLSWPERRAAMADYVEHVSDLLAGIRVSPEGQEGVRAFLEKRKPSWMNQ